jgi:hypothetical protein
MLLVDLTTFSEIEEENIVRRWEFDNADESKAIELIEKLKQELETTKYSYEMLELIDEKGVVKLKYYSEI